MRYTPPDNELYIRNRKNFIDQMEEKSLAVFFSAVPVIRSADAFHHYKQSANFLYLTGIEQENCILILHPENRKGKTETLLIPRPDHAKETWSGKMLTKEEAESLSGISEIMWTDNFESEFIRAQTRANLLYADYNDLGFSHTTSTNIEFIRKIRETLPGLQIRKASHIVHALRRVKSSEEIRLIKHAIKITSEALKALWCETKPGVKEYELEGVLAYHFIKNGSRRYAYEPIIAGGIHSATLHYVDNDSVLENGQVLLTDVGAEYGNYASDITRTVPVNGKFTDRQREVYQAVLKVQKQIISEIKPGIMMDDLNDQAKALIGKALIKLELIGDKDETAKYYMHSIGHFLGLDTHDVGTHDKPLEPGNVLTIEPGIYIPEEKLGVRIEDNILVTQKGHENLSALISKEVDEIESLVGK